MKLNHIFKIVLVVTALNNPVEMLAQEQDDCLNWFKTQYVPLWAGDSKDASKIAIVFSESFHDLKDTGEVEVKNSTIQYWEDRLKEMKESGSKGVELKSVEGFNFNSGVVLLEVKWLTNATPRVETCWVYMAVGSEDNWKITSVIHGDCRNQLLSK
jgi:hypothetical protein